MSRQSKVSETKDITANWNSVKICGVEHAIVLKPAIEMPDQLGLCHSDVQQIWLASTNTPETQLNTLLHECIHTIDHLYDLDMSERQVCVLATALIAFARDNPHIAHQLFVESANND